jgi:replicative DNA helicase
MVRDHARPPSHCPRAGGKGAGVSAVLPSYLDAPMPDDDGQPLDRRAASLLGTMRKLYPDCNERFIGRIIGEIQRLAEVIVSPPHNLEAEQALLGAILVNNGAYEASRDFVTLEQFADEVNGRIFAACATLIDRGETANPVTLKRLFDQDGDLEGVGGAQYLVQLAASVVTVVNASDYAKAIADLYRRRQMIDVAQSMMIDAYRQDLDTPAESILDDAEARLFELAENGTGTEQKGLQQVSHAVDSALDMIEAAHRNGGKISGVTTGLIDIDRFICGMQAGDNIVLAGATSMGKTALGLFFAYRAALQGVPVAFFSLEMPQEQIGMRLLALVTGIPTDRQRSGQLGVEERQKIAHARAEIAALPIHIDDAPAPTVAAINNRARRMKRRHGMGLIVVDYLQLIAPGNSYKSRQNNRTNDVSEISRALKQCAKNLKVPVLSLAQLSRSVDQRDEKRPRLSDLRESGAIEQDADSVLFIFREEYYLEREEPQQKAGEDGTKFDMRMMAWRDRMEEVKGTAELIAAKNRHGRLGKIRLAFDGESGRFSMLQKGIYDDR